MITKNQMIRFNSLVQVDQTIFDPNLESLFLGLATPFDLRPLGPFVCVTDKILVKATLKLRN